MRGFSCGLVLFAAVASLPADMRESAWQARAMLGPDCWAQVLRIEQTRPGAAPARIVHALVFELEDRLWYYSDDQGTQSLSTHSGRLARDKADLGPLLKNIDAQFGRFEILGEKRSAAVVHGRAASLPQGCFIECVAYLQSMIEAGRAPDEARLLAYYGPPRAGRQGHTVLYFVQQGQRFFYDPERLSTPAPIPDHVRPDALDIARAASPGLGYVPPVRAVFLPLRVTPPSLAGWSGREIAAGGPAAHARVPAAPVMVN